MSVAPTVSLWPKACYEPGMFDRDSRPRVFCTPPGVDFCAALATGFIQRSAAMDPLKRARSEIWVNTNRTLFRLTEAFAALRPLLLPRLATVDSLGEALISGAKPAVPRLERVFETAALVRRLIELDPGFAAPTAAFDLADSVTRLFAEMEEEGVAPEVLGDLDITDQSGHWLSALDFLETLSATFGPGRAAPTAEGRQRAVVDATLRRWDAAPPAHPVLVAGSTGSRGTTLRLMQAVARLPQGALILPGFDHDLPAAIWDLLVNSDAHQDHPQYRFAHLLAELELDPGAVELWTDTPPPNPTRNRLVSLALRPPPVTDAWLQEARGLSGQAEALAGITLIAAPDQRQEAGAIALALRQAAGEGRTCALVTPDRTLARRVTRMLERFGTEVDDTAGEPLTLTPAGRFFRQTAALLCTPPAAETLISLLKHPLTAKGSADRGRHLNRVRDLELVLRKERKPLPLRKDLPDDDWGDWLFNLLPATVPKTGSALLDATKTLAGVLFAGPTPGTASLEDQDDGRAAVALLARFGESVALFDALAPAEFLALLDFVFGTEQVRPPPKGAPVAIWGTVDARVMSADLVVLAGLNEGVWPPAPPFDPWLNRALRRAAGLRLPDRETGLSAHDFQQAIAAREVILSRSLRTGDAETVPSRWLNRLTAVIGEVETKQVVAKGNHLMEQAASLDLPAKRLKAENRPAPIPPAGVRPTRLSVTEIEKFSRDPYAIYARHLLRLKKLDPLRHDPDPRERGTVLHAIMEEFVKATLADPAALNRKTLVKTAEAVITAQVPWEAERLIWRQQFAALADWLIEVETDLRQSGTPVALESRAAWKVPGFELTLTGKADRIDQMTEGARILDYKSKVQDKAQRELSQQLALEALMVQAGAFDPPGAQPVSTAAYIGLNQEQRVEPVEVNAETLKPVEAAFRALLTYYLGPHGAYPSRRFANVRFPGDYDHLARHGEWQDSDEAVPERLT
jgi:ATP-dependent helicase/nuclease subunit B